ncbi:hypothetical protein J7M22_14010 [Candidatus Poribacteria bacterium]|nr:hypothetical protein [Candidatus Poribacteria bacterium]
MRPRGKKARFEDRNRVTFRAVLLGALLIPPNAYWIMWVEGVWNSGHSTCLSLMWHVVLNLLFLVGLNFILRRISPRATLSQAELITVYAMLTLAGGVASRDSYQILIPVMGWAFWFATPENEWATLFHRYLPPWLTVQDKEVLRPFYLGESTFYTQKHIEVFLQPIIWWTIFFTVLGFMMICINVLLRKQWTHNEKLSYPIIQIPLAITNEGGRAEFFRNRLLWIGFALGAGIDLINGFHFLFPAIPGVPVTYRDHNLGRYFTTRPWNAIGSLPLPLYPFAVGLGFFLPLDLAFSVWFFYLFRKFQQVLGAAMGLRAFPGFPYLNQQSTGAWIGLFFVAIWLARRHLTGVAKRIFLGSSDVDDSSEPFSYRLAALGLLGGAGFLTFFCLRAGMSLWIIFPYFLIFFMFSTAITKMRAELGPPTHELVNMNAANMLVDVLGTRRIGANNLSIFPLFWFFSGRGYRGHLMPHQLESFKMAEVTGMNPKGLPLAMVLAIALGSLSAFWALLHISFRVGLDLIPIGHDSGVFRRLENWLTYSRGTNTPAVSFMGVGMTFTFFLMFMRTRFLWWPFHPAGYALSMNFGVDYIWSCLLISSVLKWIVLKYGGISAYRRALPFLIGVVLGEYCMGGAWSLVSVIIQKPTYDFYYA